MSGSLSLKKESHAGSQDGVRPVKLGLRAAESGEGALLRMKREKKVSHSVRRKEKKSAATDEKEREVFGLWRKKKRRRSLRTPRGETKSAADEEKKKRPT